MRRRIEVQDGDGQDLGEGAAGASGCVAGVADEMGAGMTTFAVEHRMDEGQAWADAAAVAAYGGGVGRWSLDVWADEVWRSVPDRRWSVANRERVEMAMARLAVVEETLSEVLDEIGEITDGLPVGVRSPRVAAGEGLDLLGDAWLYLDFLLSRATS
jgi:hypothetical protein